MEYTFLVYEYVELPNGSTEVVVIKGINHGVYLSF